MSWLDHFFSGASGPAGGQLGGSYPNPTVLGLTETSGPTSLTFGAVAAGATLERSGASIIGTPAEIDDSSSGSGTKTIDFSAGPNHKLSVNGNATIAITAPTQARHCQLVLTFTGGFTLTWPAAVHFTGGTEPTWDKTGKLNVLNLWPTGGVYIALGGTGA